MFSHLIHASVHFSRTRVFDCSEHSEGWLSLISVNHGFDITLCTLNCMCLSSLFLWSWKNASRLTCKAFIALYTQCWHTGLLLPLWGGTAVVIHWKQMSHKSWQTARNYWSGTIPESAMTQVSHIMREKLCCLILMIAFLDCVTWWDCLALLINGQKQCFRHRKEL